MSDFDASTALSFDCYGTLIDWETGIATALSAWATAAGLAVADEQLVAEFAATETVVQQERPTAPYPEVLAEVLRRIGKSLGAPVTAADAHRFGGSVGDWPAFADSPEALRRLAKRFKLIILSNVDRASFAASNARLGVAFDLIVTAEDAGAYKPELRGFEQVFARLAHLGVERSGLLHVAQSLYHDHEPARRLGLPSVWIDRRRARHGYGATPPPRSDLAPRWRYPSLRDFADAALGSA